MVAEKYKKLKDKGIREMVRYAGEDIKQFLDVKGSKSENTKNTYERHIEQFVKEVFNTDMKHLTKDQLEMINYDLLQKFQNEMRSAVNEKGERIYKNSTINGKILLKNRGKGNKMKNEVIPEKLYEMLLKLKGDNEKVFSIPYGTMYDAIKRATKSLGLDEEIAAHSFKRTALTYVATSTVGNVMAIQKKGGHSTPQMAVYYAQESEAVENGAFSSTYGIDQKLYESVDHSLLLEAIGNMNSDFKIMLNAELNRLKDNEK